MNLQLVRFIDLYFGIPLAWLLHLLRTAHTRLVGRSGPERTGPEPRRILLIKFWGLGNFLMLLPAAAALRQRYPEAAIDLLTLDVSERAALCCPLLRNVLTIGHHSVRQFVTTTWRALVAMRRRHYDLIIDFEQFARFSALLTALAGGRQTIGLATGGQQRGFLFTQPVPYDNTIHMTRTFLTLAVQAGANRETEIQPVPLVLPAAASSAWETRRGSLGLNRETPYLVFHVGTSDNFHLRRWAPEAFAILADSLAEQFPGPIVLTGLPDEVALSRAVTTAAQQRTRLIDLSGKLSLEEFFLLLDGAAALVSSDTAPVHLACAAGVSVVGLYGPNVPQLYGPWGPGRHAAVYHQQPCSPCITNYNAKISVCRHPDGEGACMRAITPTEVLTALKNVLTP